MEKDIISLQEYSIHRQIHSGKRSKVYLGEKKESGLPVIVKVNIGKYASKRQKYQFQREFEIGRTIKDKHIVTYLGLEESNHQVAIIMKDFGGVSLDREIPAQGVSISQFFTIAIQLVKGLNVIHHSNIIHKDIQPSNIIINPTDYLIKYIDFAIASKLRQETEITQNQKALEGTLAYISPEQTGRMNRIVDYRSDFYSLGIVFYELLSGVTPFHSSDPMEIIHSHIAKNPTPLHHLRPDVPMAISNIVDKLLSKNAEQRYQSALGIQWDLEECLDAKEHAEQITNFVPGNKDLSDQFYIPQKLYGRESELKQMKKSFNRVNDGHMEVAVISGWPGVGKTTLINDFSKYVIENKGLFISGKYEYFKKDIPYSGLIQAFSDLIRQLLTESNNQILKWQEKIKNALGINAQIIIDVIPEVELIIGPQQPVSELDSVESQNRFHMVLFDFITIFLIQNQPTVIFLDDLQWADSASGEILKYFTKESKLSDLMLIGAYRSNAVFKSHPLLKAIQSFKTSGIKVNEIQLNPLNIENINQLVKDTLLCEVENVKPLTRLLYKKTEGNPFFLKQFLQSLYNENVFEFDPEKGWQWDINRISQKPVTDNVVKFIAEKISNLKENFQEILFLGACMGNSFRYNALNNLVDQSSVDVSKGLRKLVHDGYFIKTGRSYYFAHDRIREACYNLIPEKKKKMWHHSIGTALLGKTADDNLDRYLFSIVNHLNVAKDLINDPSKRLELAKLNLNAARKARISAAYKQAFNYFNETMALLPLNCWIKHYELSLNIFNEGVQISYLFGDYAKMDALAKVVFEQAKTLPEKLVFYERKIAADHAQNLLDDGIDLGITILRQLGIDLTHSPSKGQLIFELFLTKFYLWKKSIDKLKQQPKMTDSHKRMSLQLLYSLLTPSYFGASKIFPSIVLTMVRLSIRYGHSPHSAMAYVFFGAFHCYLLNDIETGYKLGQLALELIKDKNSYYDKSRIQSVVWNLIYHWKEPLHNTLIPLHNAYKLGLAYGNFVSTRISCITSLQNKFMIGADLDNLKQETDEAFEHLKSLQPEMTLYSIQMLQQIIYNLTMPSSTPCLLQGAYFDETILRDENKNLDEVMILFIGFFYKSILCFYFERYKEALKNIELAGEYRESVASSPFIPVFYFFDSLIRLALYPNVTKKERRRLMRNIKKNRKKLKRWAFHGPENCLHKYHLVEAETARVLGKKPEAIKHYDMSIQRAFENRFRHEQALALELYSNFWLSSDKLEIAGLYLAKACHLYQQWGANQKVEFINNKHGSLLKLHIQHNGITGKRDLYWKSEDESAKLDLETVIKSTRAISDEIDLERFLHKMIKIIIENAGAQKGAIILEQNNRLEIQAWCDIALNQVEVLVYTPLDEFNKLSKSIVHYVFRTGKNIVFPNKMTDDLFLRDDYLSETQPRSILCIPIRYKDESTGVLYLENDLTDNAFTEERIRVLDILLSQAVISMENAFVHSHLDELVKKRTMELKAAQEELVEKAHKAGMADIATNTIHNVGNILNSVRISVQVVKDTLRHSKIEKLKRANEALENEMKTMGNFNNPDSNAEKLIGYYQAIESTLDSEYENITENINRLDDKIELITDVIASQQRYAGISYLDEEYNLVELLNDTLDIHTELIEKDGIKIVRDFSETPKIMVQKTKLIQILTNLIQNAKDAMLDLPFGEKLLEIKLESDEHNIYIKVRDNGKGIAAKDLTKIFSFGFSTKGNSRGFGLHGCANFMSEMKGRIWAESEGRAKGTTFILQFPINSLRSATLPLIRD